MEIEKIDLRYAEFISDVSDNINNIRTRIIKFDNKLYSCLDALLRVLHQGLSR